MHLGLEEGFRGKVRGANFCRLALGLPPAARRRNIGQEEIHHYHPIVFRDQAQDVVGIIIDYSPFEIYALP